MHIPELTPIKVVGRNSEDIWPRSRLWPSTLRRRNGRLTHEWQDSGTTLENTNFAFNDISKDVEASNEGLEVRRIQHAIVGAAYALRKGMDLLPIALAVQAHHGRLKNAALLEDAVTNVGAALLRDAERDGLPRDLLEIAVPQVPAEATDRLYLALATRFLFRLSSMRTYSTRRNGIGAKLGGRTLTPSPLSQ